MTKKSLLLCVLFAVSSAWATSITIVEPSDTSQAPAVTVDGFLPGYTLTVTPESVVFSGTLGTGPFFQSLVYDVWSLESGTVTFDNLGFAHGLVSDAISLTISPVFNNTIFPGSCPVGVDSCQNIQLEFQSFDPAQMLITIIPGFGPFSFVAVQEQPGLQDFSSALGGFPLSVQSVTPEPSSIMMLSCALLSLAGRSLRKRRLKG